ncbi:MAG: threonine aldolase family protein [Gemmatimonadaceae bacterium]
MLIDIRSDTVTKPTPEMRLAIANAEVGDDVLDGDPTTRRLETRVADLLGKERAVYCPTGTMANQIAIWLLAERGTEVLADVNSHIHDLEYAATAALTGAQLRPVTSDGPMMDAGSLLRSLRPVTHGNVRATLVCLENTHNGAGGLVTPVSGMQAMADVARAHGCAVHLDGARLWNASVATGAPLSEFAACADTVMVSFSKGLGAPAGAVVALDATHYDRAVETRRRFGGGMRQSGVLAAAALYGLDHHLARLVEDHEKAVKFAAVVDRALAASVVPPETNIVMIDLAPGLVALDVARRAAEKGVLLSVWSPSRLRTVWHYDVSAADADAAGERVREALDEAWRDLADTSEWPAMPLDSTSLQVPKVVGPPTPSGPRR